MKRRMTIRVLVLIILFLVSGGSPLSADKPDSMFIVRGKFLGIAFFNEMREKQPNYATVKIQILIQESYTYFGRHYVGKIYSLDTGKRLNYDDIGKDTYSYAIKSYLPPNIKPGQTVLVKGRLGVEERRGFLVEEMYPYTNNAKIDILNKNSSRIKKQKEWFVKQAIKYYKDQIKTHTDFIKTLKEDLEETDPDNRGEAQKQIDFVEQNIKTNQEKIHELEKELEN